MDGFSVGIPEAVCLGASIALSGIGFYLYRKSRAVVDKLDDAPHFTIDKNLKDILKVTPGACLQYVVIEGAVQPVNETLMSNFHREIVGVLQKYVLRQQRLVWNAISRTWTDSEQITLQRVNEVPFVLVGSDETAVKVLCPLQASGAHMEIIHEKFHQINYGLSDIVGQYLSGEKLKGQLETEEMLKVGKTLTGIGELILDTDGSLNLRPPSNSSDYFLSIMDFHTLRQDRQTEAVWWKALGVISALAGAVVLLWVGWRYYNHVKQHRDREQVRREFERLRAEASGAAPAGSNASQDTSEDRLENTCVICLSRPRDCILLDCGHVCCCFGCYRALTRHLCPICRQDIKRVVPLYHV